jgi:hypothetical protein
MGLRQLLNVAIRMRRTMTWTMAIHLKSGRDEHVRFASEDAAAAALRQLQGEMITSDAGITTVAGNNTVLIAIYDAAY